LLKEGSGGNRRLSTCIVSMAWPLASLSLIASDYRWKQSGPVVV
jgi:hypothetical protein